jgi:hypothetical protein
VSADESQIRKRNLTGHFCVGMSERNTDSCGTPDLVGICCTLTEFD